MTAPQQRPARPREPRTPPTPAQIRREQQILALRHELREIRAERVPQDPRLDDVLDQLVALERNPL